MTDKAVQTLAGALAAAPLPRNWWGGTQFCEVAESILHALNQAGIAVVELPETGGEDDDGQEYFNDGDIRVDHTARGSEHPAVYICGKPTTPEDLRRTAAELLAAAQAAETPQEVEE